MSDKIVVGPINRGLRSDRKPFAIDNDSFPVLINAYQWRGRIRRKRGTSLLGRLQRYIGTTDVGGNIVVTILPTPIATGIVSFIIGTRTYVDPGGASPVNLITNGAGTATLDRTTGVLTITGSDALTAVIYYPRLPVMGLEDINLPTIAYPGTIAFDTDYAYNIATVFPYSITDISFYKNPAADPTLLPGYVPKSTWTPTTWNGEDYQQFWTTNYQGAFWATNGINVPFDITHIGMQFKPIVAVTVTVGGPPAVATLNITGHGLVVGDFVFVNEVLTTTGINFQTGYVIAVLDANNVSVEFPFATIAGNGTGGIAQYLTSRSDTTKDCLRWYDGDPTDGNATSPSFVQGKGWVNFMPPLSELPFSIADTPPQQYYLVGARIIKEFKDRLTFIGPVIQTSSGQPIYLQDVVIYSQNGTAFYTASFTGDPSLSTTVFSPVLVPENQTASPAAYWGDQTGFGGWIQAGIDQPILTCAPIQDVLILGAPTIQMRLVYSGSDINPFNFFLIDSDLSSGSTFSTINMGKGVITRGDRGIILTTQSDCERVDLDILDQVMEMDLLENGAERITALRDYVNEWVYITYPSNQNTYKFPTETLQYNYRDQSWAIFKESYTHYGNFRKRTGFTWATVGTVYPTWRSWTTPWNASSSTLLDPEVIAGNQQGFILVRDDGTNEGNSLYIQNISGNTVTSPDHSLNEGDYIVLSGIQGTLSSLNDEIFSVGPNPTQNTFVLNPTIESGTYLGGGLIKRMYRPFIQTRQFPAAWSMGRKTRIGMQQYLLTTTSKAQIQLLIYLSQDASNPFNDGPIVPATNTVNNSLIYSTVLFTCPESTNLGLTPANTNLLMNAPAGVTGSQQLWHRINTSLIGDTVQLGFTMSDSQMRDPDFNNQFDEIEIHGFNLDISPSQMLC